MADTYIREALEDLLSSQELALSLISDPIEYKQNDIVKGYKACLRVSIKHLKEILKT